MKYRFLLFALAFSFAACAPATIEGKRVALQSLNTFADGSPSTAKGEAQLVLQADGKTKLTVTVNGLTKSTKHIGHVHNGSCAAQGPVALVLTRLEADGNGNANASTVLDTAKLTGAQYVQFHQRDVGDPAGGIGGGILCGDLK
jgi:CHRD domain